MCARAAGPACGRRSARSGTFKVQLTIGRETHDKLRRVQDLLRHSVPSGDPAEILDRALTLLLADLEKRKLALTKHPRRAIEAREGSRHVPAAVRREVWQRDGGRCAFVGTRGRCAERGFLEFHHVIPFVEGGETTTVNLQLRCRSHNAFEARSW
jgi:HNH endonuclease